MAWGIHSGRIPPHDNLNRGLKTQTHNLTTPAPVRSGRVPPPSIYRLMLEYVRFSAIMIVSDYIYYKNVRRMVLTVNKSERCLAILDILQKHKVEVNELAKRFGISEMTVRRDLNLLARQYNITRTHGGALMANQPVVRMISFDESRISNREAKEKIAAKAPR